MNNKDKNFQNKPSKPLSDYEKKGKRPPTNDLPKPPPPPPIKKKG